MFPTANKEEGGIEDKARKRQNYANDDRMRTAVDEWFGQETHAGVTIDKPRKTKKQIAVENKVRLSTFEKYTLKDPNKRQELGKTAGRKCIVSDHTIKQVISDLAIQHYQPNE